MQEERPREGEWHRRHIKRFELHSESEGEGCNEAPNSDESYDESTGSEGDDPHEADETTDSRKEDDLVALHNIPMRIVVDNHVYVKRNCRNNRLSFYCATKGCKASLVFDPNTNIYRKIVVAHNHSEGLAERTRRENMTEIALRQFVRENQALESHRIYALLLNEHHRDPSKFPDIENITTKRIENIKGQLAGEIARNALKTLLPERLSEVNGTPFLQVQSVHPVTLIFATRSSLSQTRSSPTILLMKVRLEGVLLTNVYCLYAPDGSHWRPTVWIIFKEANPLHWVQLRCLLETKDPGEFHPFSRKWVIPGTTKYFDVLRILARTNDTLQCIAASYDRQIIKITAAITDTKEQKALQDFFAQLSTGNACAIESQLAHRERTGNEEVCRAIFAWRSRFTNQKSLYHTTTRCRDENIQQIYLANKQKNRNTCPSDEALIECIHEQYKSAYRDALHAPVSGPSNDK